MVGGNVGALMSHFLSNVLADAIRLKVTIDQAKYQALTVYQTIDRAMLKNPLFSWHLVEYFAPGEFINIRYSNCTEELQLWF